MKTTEILAETVLALRPRDIPPAAAAMVKRCILDLIGAAAAGFTSEAARAARTAGARSSPGGSLPVWFTELRFYTAWAAMANSQAASALDLDDGHRAAGGHPGASIIPAAFAVAEETGATAEELVASIVAGYEVAVRIAAARDFSRLDTFSTGRWCSYGTAAAGGVLRRLPPGRLAEALSIAGVLAPGLSASGYSSVMGNHVKEGIPWSTFLGLTALDLAREGFTGPTDLLDHPSYYDSGKILEGIGKTYAIEGVYFKPYSCCRWIHSALDALSALMHEHGIKAREIRKVRVSTFERVQRLNNQCNPDSPEGAQYSLPFSLAVAAVRGGRALLPMNPGLLGDPEVVALAEKVEIEVDAQLDRAFPARVPARVAIGTARGEFQRLVETPLGDPANPMDFDELQAKFRTLTAGTLTTEGQDEMISAVSCLETGGFPRLLELLREKPKTLP